MITMLTEEATFDLTYEGLIAAHAEADNPDDPSVLRIHGRDVLRELTAARTSLLSPIAAVVTIDGEPIAQGGLTVSPAGYDDTACGDPDCCPGGGYEPATLTVGTTDVLRLLESQHGQTREVRFYGRGYVEPTVDVTFAFHTGLADGDTVQPLDRRDLPLSRARTLRRRLTTASQDRVEKLEQVERARRARIEKGEEL